MRAVAVLVISFCTLGVWADDGVAGFETTGIKVALKLYEDCSHSDGFSPCLKKKALTILDRLGKMDKLSIIDGVTLVRAKDVREVDPPVTEEQLENTLPRGADARDEALTNMLFDRVGKIIGSRTVEVSLPKVSDLIEEGRGRKGGGGGGDSGGGKMKNMMGGMMMAMAAKMAALVPIAIAGLFLLAGKALITAKIALLISGIIALKKLFAAKQHGGGGGGHVSYHSSGGGGGGWQPSGGGGGGWDKRSYNDIQSLPYKAYKQH
ncbi:uncharacterized protein LOC132703645 [Cylas formicarius]|uniref:uncharacterized protein LOC132703645 n=1 Tax=Cylas formicarius TaxID=197179 RepID=UPI0029587FE2|nr:uncharacterized protein LOC132703645 [Cylas formicarius]